MERFFVSLPVDPCSLFGYDEAGVRTFTRNVERMAVEELEGRLGVGHREQIAVQWTARVRGAGGEMVEALWTPPAYVKGCGMFTCTAWVVDEPHLLGGAFALSPAEASNPVVVMSVARLADQQLEVDAAKAGQVITSRPDPTWTIERRSEDGAIAEERWQPGESVVGALRVVYRAEAITAQLPAAWVGA
jgi:hypothetical protein